MSEQSCWPALGWFAYPPQLLGDRAVNDMRDHVTVKLPKGRTGLVSWIPTKNTLIFQEFLVFGEEGKWFNYNTIAVADFCSALMFWQRRGGGRFGSSKWTFSWWTVNKPTSSYPAAGWFEWPPSTDPQMAYTSNSGYGSKLGGAISAGGAIICIATPWWVQTKMVTFPETNSKSTWKWMIGSLFSFWGV